MNYASRQAIDAYSASPALRLRSRVLSAKATQRSTLATPPAVGGETPMCVHPPLSDHARQAGDPRAVLMRLREEAADEIDRLLAFLDATEGDTDCEDTDEDAEHDGAEPDNDEEPSLGSVIIWELDTQAHWAAGGSDDRENEHDGREPSLCGITAGDGNITDCRDLEAQCDDEGVVA